MGVASHAQYQTWQDTRLAYFAKMVQDPGLCYQSYLGRKCNVCATLPCHEPPGIQLYT
jgi:hypothetical protein